MPGVNESLEARSAHRTVSEPARNASRRLPRNAKRRKVLHPETCLGDGTPGLLKHLLNEQMNTRMETVTLHAIIRRDRSGRHRICEECLIVVNGATTCTRTATWRSPTPTLEASRRGEALEWGGT